METHRRLPQKVKIEGTTETLKRDCRDLWKVNVEETVETHRRLPWKGLQRPTGGTMEGTVEDNTETSKGTTVWCR